MTQILRTIPPLDQFDHGIVGVASVTRNGVSYADSDATNVIAKATSAGVTLATGYAPGYSPTSGTTSGLPTVLSVTPTKTANYTASYGDDVPADTTAAGWTGTLPASAAGARVRWTNVSPSGTNVLTVSPSGSDTIVGPSSSLPVTLLPGESVELRCLVVGAWSRV